MALSNKPTVGADNDTWGQELNDALDELNTTKVEVGTVYTKAEVDDALAGTVKSVNGQVPDMAGNVTVATGGVGGGGAVNTVNNKTPDLSGNVSLTAADVNARPAGTLIPATDVSGLAGVAVTGKYSDLTALPPDAVPLTQKGTANGVATLDSTSKIPLAQLPSGIGGGGTLVIKQNGDGTWPARTTVTTDRTLTVFWQGTLPGPTIGTATNTAVDGVDKLIVLGPVP